MTSGGSIYCVTLLVLAAVLVTSDTPLPDHKDHVEMRKKWIKQMILDKLFNGTEPTKREEGELWSQSAEPAFGSPFFMSFNTSSAPRTVRHAWLHVLVRCRGPRRIRRRVALQVHYDGALVAAAHFLLRHSHWERLPLPASLVFPPNVTLSLNCVRCEGGTRPVMLYNKRGKLHKRRPILMART